MELYKLIYIGTFGEDFLGEAMKHKANKMFMCKNHIYVLDKRDPPSERLDIQEVDALPYK